MPDRVTEGRVADTDHPPEVEKDTDPEDSRERERPPRLKFREEMVPLALDVLVEAV